MKSSLAALLVWALLAMPASASPWRLLESPSPPAATSASTPGCFLGTSSPAEAAAPTTPGPFQVCLLVEPDGQCPQCALGVAITTVRATFEMVNPPGQACQLRAVAQLKEADLSDPDCPKPGLTLCRAGGVFTFFVSPGLNEIEFPLSCPCAAPDYSYFVSVGFVSTDCEQILRASTIQSPPPPCTSYILDSDAVIDETLLGIPGVLVLSAGSSCCEDPVGAFSGSWSSLKGQFN